MTTREKYRTVTEHFWYDSSRSAPLTVTVVEPESEKDTGLLDQHGRKIVRKREPIGFVKR